MKDATMDDTAITYERVVALEWMVIRLTAAHMRASLSMAAEMDAWEDSAADFCGTLKRLAASADISGSLRTSIDGMPGEFADLLQKVADEIERQKASEVRN